MKLNKIIIAAAMVILAAGRAEARTKYVSSTDGLYLRSGAGTDTESKCIMPFGASIDESFTDGTWSRITYDNMTGYAVSEFLSDTDPFDDMEYLGTWHITAYAYTGSRCANGNYPQRDYTIACNSLPFGTEVYIKRHRFPDCRRQRPFMAR